MFSQNLTLEEAFETDAQLDKQLKVMEFDGAFCKKNSNFYLTIQTFGKKPQLAPKFLDLVSTTSTLVTKHFGPVR